MKADPQPRPLRRGSLARPIVLAGLFAVLTTLLLADLIPRYAPGLLRFEHVMGDVRTHLLSDRLPSQHPHVAIVGITDQTLSGYKTRLPIDRVLLAHIVEALDEAGAKVIGLDFLFTRVTPADNEDMLIDAIKRAKANIVLAAADERLNLTPAQAERQAHFFAQTGRPAGYVNLATERDWVVRFKAPAAPGGAFPKSFARLLAEGAGYPTVGAHRRIAWLREPRDGSDTFLTIPAETLLGPESDPLTRAARAGLKDKIVIVGALMPDLDLHQTPITAGAPERMAGAVIHAHIVAETVDGRHIGQLEADSAVLRLVLAVLSALGFLVGWRYRLKRKGLLLSSIATVAIIAVDTIVFWEFRIILPVVLALIAWFLGEFSGNVAGRLAIRGNRKAWFVR
jgi:adenylate cyclase